jgi:hypothetical protein
VRDRVDHDRPLALGDLADERLADPVLDRRVLVGAQPVPRDQPQPPLPGPLLGQEEGPVLRPEQRRELLHDQLGDDLQVAVPLEHRPDARQVGLQPVLVL